MMTLERFCVQISGTIGLMQSTMQNPSYHGEGDVWTHTLMAMEAMQSMDEYNTLDEMERRILDYACLLHDVGKTICTVEEDGVLVSRGHSVKGEDIARNLLWTSGFNGSMMRFRETVCALIRDHGKAVHYWNDIGRYDDPSWIQRMALRTPAEHYNMRLLYILSNADLNGRICDEKGDLLTALEMFRECAERHGCFTSAPDFADGYSRFAFLDGKTYSPSVQLHDGTWGEVIVMSGLPASGKTTWIRKNMNDIPVISLDNMRRKLNIKPNDDQGEVLRAAFGMAKDFLRSRTRFIWDATCINHDMRKKIIGMSMDYGAHVRVIYLETDESTRIKRNKSRKNYAVPANVMADMRRRMVPPAFDEAHDVEWICE